MLSPPPPLLLRLAAARVAACSRGSACARSADAHRRIVQVTDSGSSYLLGKPDPAEAVAGVFGYLSRFGGYLGYMLYALLTLFVFIVFLLEQKKVRPVYLGYCSGSQLCNFALNSVDCNALNIASIASSFFFSDQVASCKWISLTPFALFCLVSLGFYLLKRTHPTGRMAPMRLLRTGSAEMRKAMAEANAKAGAYSLPFLLLCIFFFWFFFFSSYFTFFFLGYFLVLLTPFFLIVSLFYFVGLKRTIVAMIIIVPCALNFQEFPRNNFQVPRNSTP